MRFAIDDFGVGYSGLGYLDRFAFDVVKIDRGFVHRINGQSAHIVTAVIALAQGLGLDVVAEGVETLEQVEFLRRRGCNLMQGYIFSKAIDGDALGHMILQRREVLAGRMRAEDERDSALLPVPVSKVASAPVGRLRRQSA